MRLFSWGLGRGWEVEVNGTPGHLGVYPTWLPSSGTLPEWSCPLIHHWAAA